MNEAAVGAAPDAARLAWTPGEREDFFAAIERHRNATWRVSLACGFSATVLALVVAALLAPLLFCVAGIAVDLLNLLLPMPDVLGELGRAVDRLTEPKAALAAQVRMLALATLPGALLMATTVFALRRALCAAPRFTAGDAIGRAPDVRVPAEQRIVNVAEEMAIAASIPAPRVRIVPGGVNAAAVGIDERHATLLIGEDLLKTLTRAQTQGVVAHLIASIAGGDMRIGLRAATTLALFALMARIATALTGRDAWRSAIGLLRALLVPTAAAVERIVAELSDPMRGDAPGARGAGQKLTWREWAQLPLMGPVFFSCFMGGLVGTFVLAPLISLAWRQRKYMADAAAVRLTRDPDALAGALAAIAGSGRSRELPPWVDHLAVVGTGGGRGASLLSASVVPVFPPLSSREKALAKLGAQAHAIADGAFAQMPAALRALLVGAYGLCFALGAVAAGLLTVLSTMLSMLFTVAPAALLHALLRAIGH
jgi:Zn-dependent protease with chaperone function